ncbi:MAG: 16S rRNA (cytosine(967)-C(5))-methyltransferase RsmB [Bacillota bacterium]
MTEQTARGAALAALLRVERDGAYANLALATTLARSRLSARDRAFCTDLVYGTLRMRARLDFFLQGLLRRPLSALPPPVRELLRLSLYQLEFMPEKPPYAVVDEAVALAKEAGFPGLRGLVNAVLRRFLRKRSAMALPGPEDPLAHLTVTLSHPHWLAERWLARLGPEEAAALAEADNRPAPVTLRVNTLRTTREEVLRRLQEAGVAARSTALAPEGIIVEPVRPVEELPGFAEGNFFAQDEGAMLAAHALDPRPGERLLDLCAAPGGKTTHLAALAGDRAEIVALDDHRHKVDLIEKNCRRLGVKSVVALQADAREYVSPSPFDGVLLDAPCSGTGTLRRRADLRWRRRPEDLPALVALQRQLLARAAALVRPGGRLVYCTCSLEPEENEEQIRWFLGAFPQFRPGDLRRFLPPPAAASAGEDPWLYLWPHRQGTDGFFFCRLEREGGSIS